MMNKSASEAHPLLDTLLQAHIACIDRVRDVVMVVTPSPVDAPLASALAADAVQQQRDAGQTDFCAVWEARCALVTRHRELLEQLIAAAAPFVDELAANEAVIRELECLAIAPS